MKGGGVCSNSNSNSSHGGPARGWFMGGCTGYCCINRFGELGVATPEGTAHVRIDYTTPSWPPSVLPSRFCRSFLSLLTGLFSILCHRWVVSNPPLSYNVSPSLSRFSLSFSLGNPRTSIESFLPAEPTGHTTRLFSSHLLCKRTQSRPVTLSLDFFSAKFLPHLPPTAH